VHFALKQSLTPRAILGGGVGLSVFHLGVEGTKVERAQIMMGERRPTFSERTVQGFTDPFQK